MGRKKNIRLAVKPLNVRLYQESYKEIKEIAQREGVCDSDVHRKLIAEALQARRERAGEVAADPGGEGVIGLLLRIEKLLAEQSGTSVLSLQEEVQTLSSRVAYLSDMVALLLASPPKRTRAQVKQTERLFS
jgi:hypothetical protein